MAEAAEACYGAVLGCLGLSGLQHRLKLRPEQTYCLGLFWAVIDVVGDVLFCTTELFDSKTIAALRTDGPIPPEVLQGVCVLVICASLCLLRWRLSYMKEMREVKYDLTKADDVDNELEWEDVVKISPLHDENQSDTEEPAAPELNPVYEEVIMHAPNTDQDKSQQSKIDGLEQRISELENEISELKSENNLLKQKDPRARRRSSALKKEVEAKELIKNADKVRQLVANEKRYATG
jgi:hypothetical protein